MIFKDFNEVMIILKIHTIHLTYKHYYITQQKTQFLLNEHRLK